jgi:hypothetical protein
LSQASGLISNLETRLNKVEKWVQKKEEFLGALFLKNWELNIYSRSLESALALTKQIHDEANLRGLDSRDRDRLADAQGLASNLKRRMEKIEKRRLASIFSSILRVCGTLISAISGVLNIANMISGGGYHHHHQLGSWQRFQLPPGGVGSKLF